MGDYHGIPPETVTKLKTDAMVLAPSLTLTFSGLSIAEWAGIFTIVYTAAMLVKLLWFWIRHGK
jgi:hypothetical protein